MATLTIRAIDEKVKAGLCVQAARRGASTEWRARGILEQSVLGPAHDEPFAERVRRRFAAIAYRGHRPASPRAAGHPRFEGLRLPAGPRSD